MGEERVILAIVICCKHGGWSMDELAETCGLPGRRRGAGGGQNYCDAAAEDTSAAAGRARIITQFSRVPDPIPPVASWDSQRYESTAGDARTARQGLLVGNQAALSRAKALRLWRWSAPLGMRTARLLASGMHPAVGAGGRPWQPRSDEEMTPGPHAEVLALSCGGWQEGIAAGKRGLHGCSCLPVPRRPQAEALARLTPGPAGAWPKELWPPNPGDGCANYPSNELTGRSWLDALAPGAARRGPSLPKPYSGN